MGLNISLAGKFYGSVDDVVDCGIVDFDEVERIVEYFFECSDRHVDVAESVFHSHAPCVD